MKIFVLWCLTFSLFLAGCKPADENKNNTDQTDKVTTETHALSEAQIVRYQHEIIKCASFLLTPSSQNGGFDYLANLTKEFDAEKITGTDTMAVMLNADKFLKGLDQSEASSLRNDGVKLSKKFVENKDVNSGVSYIKACIEKNRALNQ